MGRRLWPAVLGLALTLLNAAKPLHVDDAAYYYYARQIAAHPFDPYGFDIFWYEQPEPANTILAPPVLPYCWAIALRLFHDRPVLWKLWLLPFALALSYSLAALFRRFARGLDVPLTAMTVLGPVILPGLNLMLDVPALALSLSSLVLFLSACDRRSWPLAVAAGLIAGLAAQTKYTGLLSPGLMVLWALTSGVGRRRLVRRLLLALLAAGVAAAIFASWEIWVASRYGESHFLGEYRRHGRDLVKQITEWGLPLVAALGGVAPAVGLLAMTALGRRPTLVGAGAAVVVTGFALVGWVEADAAVTWSLHPDLFGQSEPDVFHWSFGQTVFTLLGLWLAVAVVRCGGRLVRLPRRMTAGRRSSWFVVLWLAAEVGGYFAMTPFAAVRRVMGIVVAATVVAGRLAAAKQSAARRRLVACVSAFGVALGLFYWVVDDREASAWRDAACAAAAFVRERDPGARVWYVGHWGFQFYAERAGMEPARAGDPDRPLKSGDWLVVPDGRLDQQVVKRDESRLETEEELSIGDGLPFRTLWGYYGTSTGVPIERHGGSRVTVTIYRVTSDFVPAGKD